jgi:hypothetical protein
MVCSLVWPTIQPAQAAAVELKRQVVLSSGRPAAGARVDIWIFDGTTTRVKEHKTLRLPPDGWLRAQIEFPPSPADTVIDDHMGRRASYNRHYLVVDAPGVPVAVVPIHEATPRLQGWDQPLKLEGGGVITGRTQSGGKAVAGATVAVMWMNGILLHSLDGKVNNPGLQAMSTQDGTFKLRPLLLDHVGHPQDRVWPLCSLLARARAGSSLLLGTAPEVSPVPAGSGASAQHSATIPLGGTWTARGRVTDEVSGKAVSGARVEIATRSLWPLSPATTNARGEWRISGIPPNRKMVAVATHASTSVGWALVGADNGADNGATVGEPAPRLDETALQRRGLDQVQIRVKPLAVVEGQVEEEGTGRMPATIFPRRNMAAEVLVRYDWGEEVGNRKVGGGLVRAALAADGRFPLALPVGQHTLGISVPRYEVTEQPVLQVPATGLKGLRLQVRKRPAFFIQLSHPRLAERKDLSITIITDREFSNGISVENGLWSHTARQWGDTLKIKVKEGSGRNISTLLETVLTAKAEPWPQIVSLPDEY